MSCQSCTKLSNNKYADCPALMADGRQFTDYRPRCLVNADLMGDKTMNTYEYRQHLIKNAESLMKHNYDQAYKHNYCGPCTNPYSLGNAVPEAEQTQCDANVCRTVTVNPNGVGRGRLYQTINSAEPYIFDDGFVAYKQKENDDFTGNCETCSMMNSRMRISSRPTVPGGENNV